LGLFEALRPEPPDAPLAVQRAFWKQSELLLLNLRHPSLRAKKYEGVEGVWQARVTREWRFFFTVDGEMYNLIDITAHPR
jgi:mRNA interferase RelE/StbE